MAQAFRDIRRKESLLRKQEREANEDDEVKKAGEARPATLKNRIRGIKRLLNSGVRKPAAGHLNAYAHIDIQTLEPKVAKGKRRMVRKLESAVRDAGLRKLEQSCILHSVHSSPKSK